MYINGALNLIDGCKSTLWNPRKISAYDIFDQTNADYVITHISSVNTDIISYMKENPKLNLIINITGSNQDGINFLENIFDDEKINCPLLFNNQHNKLTTKKTNLMYLAYSADVFLNRKQKLKYNINKGIVVNKPHDKEYNGTYHTISNDPKLDKHVDIVLPVAQLSTIYNNYDEIIFTDIDDNLPQTFYDSVYSGCKTLVDIQDVGKIQNIKKILKTEQNLCDTNLDHTEIRNNVIKKHTCLHRVKSLLSQLPCKNNEIEKIDTLLEKIA
jgi:hypothetical protein